MGTARACSSPAAPTSRIKPQPGLLSYTPATGGNRGTSPRLPGQAGSHTPERVGPYRKESFGAASIQLAIKRQYNLLLLLVGGCHEWSPSSGVDVIMSDANAEFIDALIRLLLEPVFFPLRYF